MDSPSLFANVEPPAIEPGEIAAEKSEIAPAIDETAPIDVNNFDWCEDDSVIMQEQLAVAVYRNRAGGIVIRQEARSFDEDDNFVVLRDAEAVNRLVKALRREAEGRAG